ncbi:MAG: hypothetical protein IJS01_09760 [Lentisphaeria bacterium]|nr:hypothetical protein [Lentisphaeria bacterium]
MKKLFLIFAAVIAGTVVVSAAGEKAEAVKAAPEEVRESAGDGLRPVDQWTFFQIAFLPHVPSAAMNSNVYGIKSGWPITCGIGRIYGLEASWLYSGTEQAKGIQASWVCCYDKTCDGLQSSFVICINRELLRGLQATLVYSQTGDLMGIQGSLVSLASDVYGLQAGLAFARAKDVMGFQAAGVCVNGGKLSGVQCNLYGQVNDSNGVQLGIVNVSHGKGVQFGLINYIKDGFLPVFPIFNFGI